MRHAEFEETEYEGALYSQLQSSRSDVWSPGRVLEEHVGIDYAIMCSNPHFWAIQGFAAPPCGVILDSIPYVHSWLKKPLSRPLPDFSLNLFIQAKRPLIGTRIKKALRLAGVKSPYWKFIVTPHQQRILEKFADFAQDSALFTYACPAFDRVNELWAHSRAGTIVQASTFPSVHRLRGHSAWYYNVAGCTGVANPEIEQIEDEPLPERIERFLRRADEEGASTRSFGENLSRLAAAAIQAAGDVSISETGRIATYFEVNREIDRYLDAARPLENFDVMRDYLRIASFASLFHLHWHVLARPVL